MILQALVKEYENLAENNLVPKRGWGQAKVSYAIDLNPNGKIKEIYPLKTEQTSGKKKVFLPVAKSVPEMVTRSSGVAANFLCDNVKYMLGIDQNGTNARVQECFQAAKEKHLALLKNVDEPMANAICNFFNLWDPETAYDNACVREKSDELNEGGNVIFCMGNDFAQDNDTIKKIWDNYVVHQTENTNDGICLATGEKTEIARIHRGIKGVPGAQTSGAALVSFNAPAFESYGKEQSYNAPVGKNAEFAYTTALNYLLSNRDKIFQLGDSMVVYWAENGMEEYQKTFSFVMNPHVDNEEQLQRIFDSLKKSELAAFRRHNLGFIFQNYNLLDTLTLGENISLSLLINGAAQGTIQKRIHDIANQVGIGHLLDKLPSQVSGGERQRCAFARAVVNSPKLIFADEPTGALDSASAISLMKIIASLNHTLHSNIFLVTHDALCASYADRVLFLKDGKIFSELVKGEKKNREFYHEILDNISLLGE